MNDGRAQFSNDGQVTTRILSVLRERTEARPPSSSLPEHGGFWSARLPQYAKNDGPRRPTGDHSPEKQLLCESAGSAPARGDTQFHKGRLDQKLDVLFDDSSLGVDAGKVVQGIAEVSITPLTAAATRPRTH